jgi:acyl-CoA synthetase (AMP-forming)/AMP-acid ligase II
MNMQHFLNRFQAAVLISVSLAVPALAQNARGPATQEEIAHVEQIAAASDKDPVATMTSADGRWFQKWTVEVPDYNFGPDKAAFWLMNGAAKGELKRVVIFHHDVSTAAYQLQHHIQDPRKTPESLEATTIAGLEGVLRAYENMLATHPEIRTPALDAALAARDKNMLPQFVAGLPPMPQR